MTLPASGAMTAAMINVELGRSSTAPFDINGAAERALAGVPTGAISFADFYGKSSFNFSATTSPGFLSKSGSTNTIITDPTTATPVGGTGPFTYQWFIDSTSGDATVTFSGASNTATARFRSILSISGQSSGCEAHCEITDTSNGQVRSTGTVAVEIQRT